VIVLRRMAMAEPSLDRWIAAFRLAYRAAHDGALGSSDGDGQAIAPVRVSPRRFPGVSDSGALCHNKVVSPNRKTLKSPQLCQKYSLAPDFAHRL
jgi:hypothetical protein